jgi:hypothetical protein
MDSRCESLKYSFLKYSQANSICKLENLQAGSFMG